MSGPARMREITDPILQTMPFVCLDCRYRWSQKIIQACAVEVFTAHAKTIHCPMCGADWQRVAFATKPEAKGPPTSVEEGIPDGERQTLTARESTKITGIGLNRTYQLLRSGEMPSIHAGKRFFIPRVALLKWLASR